MITIRLSVLARVLATNRVKLMGGKAGLVPPVSVRALAEVVGHPLAPINLAPNDTPVPLTDIVFEWADPGFGSIRQATQWRFVLEQLDTRATVGSGTIQGPSPSARVALGQSAFMEGKSYSWGIHPENEYSAQDYPAYARFHIQPHSAPPPPKPIPKPALPKGDPGYSDVQIYNCHVDHRSVYIWLRTWPPLGAPVSDNLGEFKAQYNDNGQCPWENNGDPADPFTVPFAYGMKLESGSIYEIFCVDPDAIGCTVGAADELIIQTQACVRISKVIKGNRDGDTFTFRVD